MTTCGLLRMRQRRVRKGVGLPDCVGWHGREGLPRPALGKARSGTDGNRLAPGHGHLRIQLGLHIVPALQELPLRGHDLRLGRNIRLHDLVKGLHRLLGIERVTVKVKAQDLALLGLARQCIGGGHSLRGQEERRAIVR